MRSTRIVIDTNILVAALRSKRGSAHKLLSLLPEDRFVPCLSVPLFLEYESVAKREGTLSGLSATDIDAVLDYVLSKSSIRKIFYLWRPFLKDPKDDMVLEVAVESGSEFIVTFNKKDFGGIEQFGIDVLTPRELLIQKGLLK